MNVFGAAHVYHGDGVAFENEGIVSTFPAIVSVIFGFIVGHYVRSRGKEKGILKTDSNGVHPIYQTLSVLFIVAVGLLFIGYLWSLFFPINKKIQSSSFIVVTTGLAILLISTLIYFIEIKHKRGWWTHFFNVFGKNALFIYALSEIIGDLFGFFRINNGITDTGQVEYIGSLEWFYQNICAKIPGAPEIGSLVYAICIVLFLWVIAYWMNKKKIYIKV